MITKKIKDDFICILVNDHEMSHLDPNVHASLGPRGHIWASKHRREIYHSFKKIGCYFVLGYHTLD